VTRKGEHAMPGALRELMGRLHALHLATSPERIARHLGVSPEYVRRQYRDLAYVDMRAALERAKRLIDTEVGSE